MIQINVSADIEKATRHLTALEKRHIPFATALALTEVAKHAQATVTAQLPSIFDRPTPFTLRAIGMTPATKTNQTATVLVKPLQAEYLNLEETGGERTARSGKSLPEPAAIGLNQYGNIARNKIAQLVGKPGYFIGTVKGVRGLYKRPVKGKAGPLQLMARFVPGWSIKPVFHFKDRVAADVARTLPGAMKRALDRAIG
jgi:hypothetical protein